MERVLYSALCQANQTICTEEFFSAVLNAFKKETRLAAPPRKNLRIQKPKVTTFD